MANIILNPTNIPEAVSTGYQRQNTLIYAGMAGFSNINMPVAGVISGGSIIEINGSLAKSTADEVVADMDSIPVNSVFYVYAVPVSETEIEYRASTQTPVWSTEKCGFYLGENRAVFKASKDDMGNVLGAVKINDILYYDIPLNTGGVQVYSKNVVTHESFYRVAGWYRFEMASGLGNGKGGNGGTAPGQIGVGGAGGAGGVPATANYRGEIFYHQAGEIIIHIGGNGYNGSSGGNGRGTNNGGAGGGGGGGSGGGDETYIISGTNKFTTGKIKSGDGGNGGNGTDVGSIGGYGGEGSRFGGTGTNGGGAENSGGRGGVGFSASFSTPGAEEYGGSGGGGGAWYYGSNSDVVRLGGGGGGGTVAGGAGGTGAYNGLNGSGGGGSPGSARSSGSGSAGYCKIFALTTIQG
jgi:hypothetical protein